MRRRDFIKGIVGSVVAWPLAAQSQNAPRIGWMFPGASAGNPTELAGFKEGLRELGYVEGRNIVVEYRFGENSAQRLSEFATELAQLNVNVIVTLGELATRAAGRRIRLSCSCRPIRSATG
jgi:putative ABC transport system substrate-binding protein